LAMQPILTSDTKTNTNICLALLYFIFKVFLVAKAFNSEDLVNFDAHIFH